MHRTGACAQETGTRPALSQERFSHVSERKEEDQVFDAREYKEQAVEFSETYKSLIDFLSGKSEGLPDVTLSNKDDERAMKEFIDAVRVGLLSQQTKNHGKILTGKDLLASWLKKYRVELTPEEEEVVRVENQGRVPIVIVPSEIFHRGRTDAQAMARKSREGTSFIIVQEYTSEYDNKHKEENIPHETHHVAWGWATIHGAIHNSERGTYMRSAFQMYQDELMATTTSGVNIHGYGLERILGSEKFEEVKKRYPEEVEQARGYSDTLYEINHALIEEIKGRETDVVITDVSLMVFRATNFQELKVGFEKLLEHVRSQPKKKHAEIDGVPSGWAWV